MRDLIWEIAKSGEEDLTNTELHSIEEPKELYIARGLSSEAKRNTTSISNFVDAKMATNVEENGAIRIGKTVFNFSKSSRTVIQDARALLNWATNKELSDEAMDNLLAVVGNNFSPKLRGIDAVAGRKGMDTQVARDTFTDKVWDEKPKLQAIDIELPSAPKWAKELADGKRR